MVNDNKNSNSKFSSFKDLFKLGSADILGAAISSVFWLLIATFIEVEEYGNLHYLISIAGIAYVFTMIGSQHTIVVYTAKKLNIVPTLFFISILGGSITAIVIFFITNKLDVSLLILSYTANELVLGYFLGKKHFSNYSKYIITQRTLTFALGIGFYFLFGIDGIIFALALSYSHFIIIIIKVIRNNSLNVSSLKTNSGFVINNYVNFLIGGFRANIDKLIIAPLLGFVLLGNISLALQFYAIMMIAPQMIFKYTLTRDASNNPTSKVKIWTFIFAIITCITTIILAPYVIPLFFPKFLEVVFAIQILSIGVIPAAAGLSYTSKFLGNEQSKFPLFGVIIYVIITIVGIVSLGSLYGIMGLSISYVLASVANFLFLFIMNYYQKLK